MASITIRGLGKSYSRGAPVIRGLDLHVAQGEFVSLLGPSGCGKTTTLRCVAGLEQPDAGEVLIDDRVVATARESLAPAKRHVGMVFQSYALWPHLSVAQNVEYPLRTRKVPRSDRRRQVDDALASVGLTALRERPATLLSGGQQQRVALARAIVGSPSVLLFDEPLSNLDAQLRANLRQEVRRVHDRAGLASLFVTHDQVEATELSDRVLVMRAGRVEQVGTPRELYRDPQTRFVAEFLGYENFLPGVVSARSHDTVTVQIAAGPLVCASRRPVEVGDRAVLTIRSQDVVLHRERPEGRPNVAAATLTSFVFSGDDVRYECEIAGIPLRAVSHDGRSAASLELRPGPQHQEVHLELPPDRLVLLPDEPGGSGSSARPGPGA